MNKHAEHSHQISPSKKLVSCIQSVYCGSSDYLIVKTDTGQVIYAQEYWNGYCDWPCGKLYWNENDELVDDRIYLFYEPKKNDQLSLMNGSAYYGDDLSNQNDDFIKGKLIKECFDNAPMFWKDEIHVEHRLVKYKRDTSQQKMSSYEPFGYKTEFNCELVVINDIQGPLFRRWKSQDKCRIFLNDWASNPFHPNHDEWIISKPKLSDLYKIFNSYKGPNMSYEWFVQEKPWTEYNNDNVYY